MGDAAAAAAGTLHKSYFDVLGICCPSEVPLVEKLLRPLPGVRTVTVIVPSRTVIVLHDAAATSPAQIGTPRHGHALPLQSFFLFSHHRPSFRFRLATPRHARRCLAARSPLPLRRRRRGRTAGLGLLLPSTSPPRPQPAASPPDSTFTYGRRTTLLINQS
jgi:copper chaperone CopZ